MVSDETATYLFSLLQQLNYVFSFDFSKAFDTVRHASLMTKFAQLEIPDCIYNWIKDFFDSHAHCTKYSGLVSAVATIYGNVIQGSALGPTSYIDIVTAADLHQVYAGNRIFKFADDTYLVVHVNARINVHTCQAEIEHLHTWVRHAGHVLTHLPRHCRIAD